MEVERLEKLSAIGNLKNLRYLGMCGLSKLTELPKEVGKLLKLEVLDVRGCQNLTCVSSSISNLRQLTHLDLTECYMLEQIRREITFLSELQVFKGFVFSTDAEGYWNKMCRLQDLGGSMKKLHKLSINVTTDANVDKNEMAQLRFLDALKSLTITWGELPSVLTSAGRSKQKDQLLDKWTSLVLPPNLEKLDVRCYPKKEIPSEWFKPKRRVTHEKLMKLYVRGGAVEKLDLPEDNKIEILRLRYLKEFNMKWSKMHDMMKNLRYVEFVVNDSKVMKSKKGKQQDANVELKPNIPEYILDEHGVWELDKLEPRQNKKDSGDPQGPTTEQPTNNNVETGGVVAYHNEDIPKTHDSKKAHEGMKIERSKTTSSKYPLGEMEEKISM
uniref:Disease resistance R13L4/SHOC-2-like LRR domain-containing protein n=2 Tax=Oryza brachyantha TaxID=4533 RepID=J3LDP2_ORYBR